MPVRVAIPKETAASERRAAIEPGVVKKLTALGCEVVIEQGAGSGAQIPDAAFVGATMVDSAQACLAEADVVLKVQAPEEAETELMKEGAIVVGFMSPHKNPERVAKLRDRKITAHAVELIPRISRAQSMDALSSQAAVAGYKAALMGAELTNRFFPMLTTAAGTIRPSTVLVIGAGVAGLQAIATARRLGAIVEGYDIRPATREQVESLGAKFVDTGVKAEGAGGYARELTEEEKAQQQQVLADHVAKAHVVITTAAIPGRPSPKIINEEMVARMLPGAVIVDLAAEGGGNCVYTQPGETIEQAAEQGNVIVHGPLNIPSLMPFHATEMYAKNLLNFLTPMIKEGALAVDWEDEIIRDSALTHAGEIRHAPTRQLVEGE